VLGLQDAVYQAAGRFSHRYCIGFSRSSDMQGAAQVPDRTWVSFHAFGCFVI
jgi:hypothetical protein